MEGVDITSNPDEVIQDRRENMGQTIPHEDVKKRVLADVEDAASDPEDVSEAPEPNSPTDGSVAASETLEPEAYQVIADCGWRFRPTTNLEEAQELVENHEPLNKIELLFRAADIRERLKPVLKQIVKDAQQDHGDTLWADEATTLWEAIEIELDQALEAATQGDTA